ncbi:MAG: hypothetical protein ACRC0A_05270, partial [Chitinophagaceae bacterium]
MPEKNTRQELIEKFLTGYKITREDWIKLLMAYALVEEAAKNTTPATVEEVLGGSDNEKFITSFLLDYFWKNKVIKDDTKEVESTWSSKKIMETITASEAGMLSYKGQVADIAALNAITEQKVGDTYNVLGDGNDSNYTWSGTHWDKLGGNLVVDKSPTKDSPNPVSSGGVFEGLDKKLDKSSLPAGIITMWSGSIVNIPAGWALCNGANGTPDLRDRFVVGAGNGYNVGATGGEATHRLNVNEMPVHIHGISGGGAHNHQSSVGFSSGGGGTRNGLTLPSIAGKYEQNLFYSSSVGEHAHTIYNEGGGQPHENRPPYYALYFIMKIK